jgi:hypothetical protein
VLAVIRSRLPFALAAAAATALPYAEGVLKNGWIEAALLAPVAWYLVAPRGAATAQNLLVSLIAVIVTVCALDLALRPVLERRLHYTALNVSAHKLPRLPIVGRWDPNMLLADDSYGDLAAVAQNPSWREPRRIVFRTDAAGFRNDPVTKPVDLVVLGDSFAAGWGTTQDRVFASLLASRYGRSTYNLSFPGGPYDQYVNFAVESPRLTLAPHALVVWTFYTGNDLDDAYGQTWAIEELPWKSTLGAGLVRYRTFRNRSPLNRLLAAVQTRVSGPPGGVVSRQLPDGRTMLFEAKHEAWPRLSEAEVARHPNFPKLERTLAAMRTVAGQRGVELIVLIFPTKGEVYRWLLDQRDWRPEDDEPSGFARAVLHACGRTAVRCTDLKPVLVREARRLLAASGEFLWWSDDTHLGERGHEAVAKFIAEEVVRQDGFVSNHRPAFPRR